MVKICEEMKGCRYWGYEPASGEFAHSFGAAGNGSLDRYKREREQIKAAGHKAIKYGMVKLAAHNEAEFIENQTGVNMRIFNHDYL